MKVVVVIAQEKFNNKEFITVTNALKINNILFDIASVSKSEAFGYIPFSVFPDVSIKELNIFNYDCLIIIGGSGNKKYLWKNTILHEKIQIANKENKILAAICLAPICFIYAGIINQSKITAYKTNETKRIIKESGNFYENKDICVNNNIITANGPKASDKFCETILLQLL